MKRLILPLIPVVLFQACSGSDTLNEGTGPSVGSHESEIRNGTFTTSFSGVGLLRNAYGFQCTATLLSGSLAVLTAAHCVTTNAQSTGPQVAPSQLTFDF